MENLAWMERKKVVFYRGLKNKNFQHPMRRGARNFSRLLSYLPSDYKSGCFVGRIQMEQGPCVVSLRNGILSNITKSFPTVSHLLSHDEPIAAIDSALSSSDVITESIESIFANSTLKEKFPFLLAPNDIQSIKAAGVTFAASLLERVIEEQAKGSPERATEIRKTLHATVGTELTNVKPGSKQALLVKQSLIERGLWSQYLEVGLGEDCELFTKSQPLSAVGFGSKVGILRKSTWNNPEPEIVLCINSKGKIVGCTLGNDVNLRDIEGRSALLLGKAKDNNASCSIGPFIRFIDNSSFTLDDIRNATLKMSITGVDNFSLSGESNMKLISRDITEIAEQAINRNHQYPDSLVLFVGTMFSPTKDRDAPGKGFTHKVGDIVEISSTKLGCLINTVDYCDQITPWTFGIRDLFQNLASRNIKF